MRWMKGPQMIQYSLHVGTVRLLGQAWAGTVNYRLSALSCEKEHFASNCEPNYRGRWPIVAQKNTDKVGIGACPIRSLLVLKSAGRTMGEMP
jgi:hypothetical protein